MKFFLTVLLSIALMSKPIVYDFGNTFDGSWKIINDSVMGGMSEGTVEYLDNSFIFSGHISLENNGGFSSFRSPYGHYNYSPATHAEIRYRSAGLVAGITLVNNRAFFLPNYKYILADTDNKWQTKRIPLSDFKEYRLGRETGNGISQEVLEKLIRIGFVTLSKKTGAFMLEVDYLKFD